MKMKLVIILTLFTQTIKSQKVNLAPSLLPNGDLINFTLFENVAVNTIVYTLKGFDPEGEFLSYTISGDVFSVNKSSGDIILREPLDREKEETLEVVITLTDESFHLLPFRREIKVLDINDNRPKFEHGPYRFNVDETSSVGSILFSSLLVKDEDVGDNSKIDLICDSISTPEACNIFEITVQELEGGSYIGLIRLNESLNYEERSSYTLAIKAIDHGIPALSSATNVFIEVNDVQDQAPLFINSPYSSTIEENTSPGTQIFEVKVRDGDTGIPRNLSLSLIGDDEGFFELVNVGVDENLEVTYSLISSSKLIDRESSVITDAGGLYTFQILAREIINDHEFGDSSKSNVTLVIIDTNDEIPQFNLKEFSVAIPEEVGADTPLPDLNIVVEDKDSSKNSKFELKIHQENLEFPNGPFSVYPTSAIGRTPVILRVSKPELLDYESEDKRYFDVQINALVDGEVLSSTVIHILVTDSNDNAPQFNQSIYEFTVPENAESGHLLGIITAVDKDSGRFGQVEYALKGFGSEKFKVNSESGEILINSCGDANELISISHCLDFESRNSFSLTYIGTDGGQQSTTSGIIITITDVNDNYPKFTGDVYVRHVNEGDTSFDPPLIIEATDADSETSVFYSIASLNTDATIFDIDPLSGEISILIPIPSHDKDYDLVIRATDSGKPALHSDVQVTIVVNVVRNEKPIFDSLEYHVTITENTEPGSDIITVSAADSDSPKQNLKYSLYSGTKDNFVINAKSGVISVSSDAVLDIQENGDVYTIVLRVSDGEEFFEQIGEASLIITIQDINDKPPKFDQNSYTMYISERKSIGEEVLTISAKDPDRSAVLEYDIISPITAMDKTGNMLTNTATYDYTSLFSIDPNKGKIFVNAPLSYQHVAVLIITCTVADVNANNSSQTDSVEVTLYIQAYKADNPQFSSPWNAGDPSITLQISEEKPISSLIHKLMAYDPLTESPISHFEKVELSDSNNYFRISSSTGEIFNNKILDYETTKQIQFQVRAIAGSNETERISEAVIILNLNDINDNFPIFEQQEYETSLNESALPLSFVFRVKAVDADSGTFGEIRYSLIGEGSEAFDIHPLEGTITVKAGVNGRSNVDRENMPEYILKVLATDNPNISADQKTGSTFVKITIIDDNDSSPEFSETRYSAVVPENSAIGTIVTKVNAIDPDLDNSGRVTYSFAEKSLLSNSYSIDSISGEIRTSALLTGKGRQAPYVLLVRAMDGGDPALFKDSEVYVTVGDVSSNDGVPSFIKPSIDEIAHIAENSPPGSKVFQVLATDPDSPETANGKIVFTLPDDGSLIRKLFSIDSLTGLLTTKVKLDREERNNYTVILEIKDLGTPPQQKSRTLTIVVDDVDDHYPVFERQRNSLPLQMEVVEGIDLNSEIGIVRAKDEDEGENALIDYSIIDGNEDKIFKIARTDNNEGQIRLHKHLDREFKGEYLLTIRCFRPYEKILKSQLKRYDNTQMDEIQLRIIVLDIDDNPPIFQNLNITLGVRVNAPIYTKISRLEAFDRDPDAFPIEYSIVNITFFHSKGQYHDILDNDVFIIDKMNGDLQTNQTLGRFTDGYFAITVAAFNSPEIKAINLVKIFVLKDTELMRFIFNRDPTFVRHKLPELKNEMKKIFPSPLTFNIYDTEFFSKGDGSLDFGRTSSCFQVLGDDQEIIDVSSFEKLLQDASKLKDVFKKYEILDVDRCAHIKTTYDTFSGIHIALIIIGLLIAILAIISSFTLCCLYSKYKLNLYRHSPVKIVEAPVRTYVPSSLPPGSIIHSRNNHSPSITGSDGRILFDSWHHTDTIPADLASYRSLH